MRCPIKLQRLALSSSILNDIRGDNLLITERGNRTLKIFRTINNYGLFNPHKEKYKLFPQRSFHEHESKIYGNLIMKDTLVISLLFIFGISI